MSQFDPQSFLETDISGKLSTRMVPVPEGEFEGVISKMDVRSGVSQNGNEYHILDLQWEVDDPSVAKETGRDINTVRQSIFLDITDDGTLDTSQGKNVQLGKLREAVGQNDRTKKWNPRMLEGQRAKILVSHRVNGEDVYAEVKKTAAV